MGTITGQVKSTNSLSGSAYASNQLVLYMDVSECPTASESTATVTFKIDYTASGSVWKFANYPTVTLSKPLPFPIYTCVQGLVPASESSNGTSTGKVSFINTISANSTGTFTMRTIGPSVNVRSGTPLVNAISISPQGMSAGLSLSVINSESALTKAVGTPTVISNHKFTIKVLSASVGT